MYSLLKKFFFLFQPEKAHYLALSLFGFVRQLPIIGPLLKSSYQPRDKSVHLFGLTFKNPIGLAAGFDKNGEYIESMQDLGFGFIEVGTVTPVAQAGNPQPRLFRLPKDEGLINRMGFNNKGVDFLTEQLKNLKKRQVIIGGNIGKNKVTPNDKAVDDYLICLRKLHPFVDYFVVNVSSPNTPNLRELQEKEPLTNLLKAVKEENESFDKARPILLKIAPDLTEGQLDDIIDIVSTVDIDGIIATNTTISREGLVTDNKRIEAIGNGGLSGQPVRDRSTEVISYIHKQSKGKVPIIGVGGIRDSRSAQEKLDAGATLVQLYSAFIYEGPAIVKNIMLDLK
jgi:dihydroorotate dehydrogenase